MARDGYESDRNRLCVYELATGKKNYVSEMFDSSVEGFVWNKDNKSLSFIGVLAVSRELRVYVVTRIVLQILRSVDSLVLHALGSINLRDVYKRQPVYQGYVGYQASYVEI